MLIVFSTCDVCVQQSRNCSSVGKVVFIPLELAPRRVIHYPLTSTNELPIESQRRLLEFPPSRFDLILEKELHLVTSPIELYVICFRWVELPRLVCSILSLLFVFQLLLLSGIAHPEVGEMLGRLGFCGLTRHLQGSVAMLKGCHKEVLGL